jgi:hypothetical protein
MDWQIIATVACVALAAWYVGRAVWRTWRPTAGGCGGCGTGCSSPAGTDVLIPADQVTVRRRRCASFPQLTRG